LGCLCLPAPLACARLQLASVPILGRVLLPLHALDSAAWRVQFPGPAPQVSSRLTPQTQHTTLLCADCAAEAQIDTAVKERLQQSPSINGDSSATAVSASPNKKFTSAKYVGKVYLPAPSRSRSKRPAEETKPEQFSETQPATSPKRKRNDDTVSACSDFAEQRAIEGATQATLKAISRHVREFFCSALLALVSPPPPPIAPLTTPPPPPPYHPSLRLLFLSPACPTRRILQVRHQMTHL